MKGLVLRLLLWIVLAFAVSCGGAQPPVQNIDPLPVAATVLAAPSPLSVLAKPAADPSADADSQAGMAATPEGTPIVDAASPEFVPTLDKGETITGQVLLGSAPVPGLLVQLRSYDPSLGKWIAVLETPSDDKGDFILENPPAGDYSIGALFPGETEMRSAGQALSITPGKSISGIHIVLVRDLTLLQPAPNASVGPVPQLKWSGFPNAASYRALVTDSGTTESVFEKVTGETEIGLTSSLTPGRTYTWTVTALTARGEILSTGSSRFIVADTAPAALPGALGQSVPAACRAEGQKAKQYLNVGDNYCYLYPARFEPREIEPGRMGVAGPALDQSAEPVYARLVVTAAQVRETGDLTSMVDQALREYAGMNVGPISRKTIEIGGEPAIVAEPIPGYLISKVVFVQHGGWLYRLDFWPQQVAIAKADVEELFQLVTTSFSFLDAT